MTTGVPPKGVRNLAALRPRRSKSASSGDAFGANLRVENYSVNSLNQYTQRTVPGRVDVLGAARTNGTVTVNLQPTYRKGEYFRAELTVDNAAAPVWLSVTNIGALKDGANPDIVSTNTGNVLLAMAVEAFTHDADGNLTSDSVWTNSWSGENRLIAVESASGVPSGGKAKETWSHLPDGRWVERVIYTWNGSAYVAASTNRFVWDRQVLLAVLNHTNGVVTSFLRGLDLSGSHQAAGGVAGVLAVNIATNGVHFTSYDGNGNVSAMVSAPSGSVSARYDYSPFGAMLRAEGVVAKANPLRWSTQFADDITGTVKYLFRDHQEVTGRWLSRDPIGEKGGKNVYAFVKNFPVGAFDLLGLQCCCTPGDIDQPLKISAQQVGMGQKADPHKWVDIIGALPEKTCPKGGVVADAADKAYKAFVGFSEMYLSSGFMWNVYIEIEFRCCGKTGTWKPNQTIGPEMVSGEDNPDGDYSIKTERAGLTTFAKDANGTRADMIERAIALCKQGAK